ncbi:alpha-D-ribose 1-methylphosphonate 5-triphosphate diphosphatase [Arenibaculum pallidiluteum]|uniref:alpha-D-ribose 1-methylphosphonate 5-triphosphate diphosphatase n=1 Tax=Arenibaculum pallidiluteum TaxID=2812559 RepID=UPI001A97429B|nr:alpha-D-ribose 1-methylphosphonate 5-triphosphate diphosphatase [Arenibaculum pallidiluteum]
MSGETILTNARLVLHDEVVHGTLVLAGGTIRGLSSAATALPAAIDLEGDYLLPGLIELHTDNLEKHFQPRPGAHWPSPMAAVIGHDLQVAGAGITTVLDAVSVGEYREGSGRRKMLSDAVAAVDEARSRDLLRADHLLHMRCEVSDHAVVEIFEPFADHPLLRLVSLMDHTPGQRQWAELSKYRLFHKEKKWTDEEFAAHLALRSSEQQRYAVEHRRRIVDMARERGLTLASHDDTIPAHVDEAVGEGVTISEFPTTLDAARHARARGLKTVMGAPNVVRGGSHSGNVSAGELASAGLLDGLSSDYVPLSLLHAAFLLHDTHGLSLPAAVATVSANIAGMLGLDDRGAIAPGLRGDLVRVRRVADLPVALTVWRQGRRVV